MDLIQDDDKSCDDVLDKDDKFEDEIVESVAAAENNRKIAAGGVEDTIVEFDMAEQAEVHQDEATEYPLQSEETTEDSFTANQNVDYGQSDYPCQEDVTEEVEFPIQEELILGDEQREDLTENSPAASLGEDHGKEVESSYNDSFREDSENGSKDIIEENDDESEGDFDHVVEVEELKAGSDIEDDNIAQHISDSEEDDDIKIDGKLGESENEPPGASPGLGSQSSTIEDEDSPVKTKPAIPSSDEDDTLHKDDQTREKHEAAMKMFDSESEDEKEGVGDLIADIFGESDDETEEFTGFGAEEVENKKVFEPKSAKSDSEEDHDGWKSTSDFQKSGVEADEDSDDGVQDSGLQGMSDFDIMLAKKKEENRRHRKRRDNSTFISDADDIINAMLTKMKEAAEADRAANQHRRPALKKLKMLPTVINHLKKQNLKELFVDNGVIAAIADWLSLLPDRSLPHITIRTELLQVLHDLPSVGPETLKHSGIGKAVMILFKHPKEARSNKDSVGRLINKWSRPIFGLNENFKSMTREEREQRDLEQMPQAKRRKLTGAAHDDQGGESRGESELGHLRPGEAGFVMRARVPMPSTKDYVVRPKWNVEVDGRDDEESDAAKMVARRRRSAGAPRSSKKDERLEKHIRNFAERRKSSKVQRAVKISIEGNKMSIL